MTRRRGNVDSNHREIVKALEGIGASVTSLANLGDGVPDLLVGWGRRTRLMEVKDGRKAPSKRKARATQEEFAARWNGEPVCLIQSPEEAIEAATADVVPARLLLDPSPALERAARGTAGRVGIVLGQPESSVRGGLAAAAAEAGLRRRVMG